MSYEFTESVVAEKSRLAFVGRRENDRLIQELLFAAAYHAHRGNPNPINAIYASATESKTTKLEGLNRWVRQNMPIVTMKEGKFSHVKGWVKSEVKSYEEFARTVLPSLKAAPTWWEVAPKVSVQREWDGDKYLNNVIDTLRKHGQDAAANEILVAKAKLVKVA